MGASEIMKPNMRPSIRTRHRRTIFLFNDIAVVCKRRRTKEYLFKETFSLLDIVPVKFETLCKQPKYVI